MSAEWYTFNSVVCKKTFQRMFYEINGQYVSNFAILYHILIIQYLLCSFFHLNMFNKRA